LIKLVESQGDGLDFAITPFQNEYTFVIERHICRLGKLAKEETGSIFTFDIIHRIGKTQNRYLNAR
jgi:hypothetical protein